MSPAITLGPRLRQFSIRSTWDGRPWPGRAEAWLVVGRRELVVSAFVATPAPPRVPASAARQRTERLWEYDVVEVFLASSSGYTEIELGPDGRFLVLGFRGPRELVDEHRGLREPVRDTKTWAPGEHHQDPGYVWTTGLSLPSSLVPRPLERINFFAHVGGELLAYSPLPGPKPDFHQPDRFPACVLE